MATEFTERKTLANVDKVLALVSRNQRRFLHRLVKSMRFFSDCGTGRQWNLEGPGVSCIQCGDSLLGD